MISAGHLYCYVDHYLESDNGPSMRIFQRAGRCVAVANVISVISGLSFHREALSPWSENA